MRVRCPSWRQIGVVVLLGLCLALGGCNSPAIPPDTSPATPLPTLMPTVPPPTRTPTAPPLAVRDETIASDYYWVHDGERIDRRPTFSPDGRWVAWVPFTLTNDTWSYRLLIRDTATGEVRDLTIDPAIQVSSPRWSPDSRSLAFVAYRPSAGRAAPSAVWRVEVGDGARRLLYRDENAQGIPVASGPSVSLGKWSPDGTRLAIGGTIWGGRLPGGIEAGAWISTDGSATITPVPRLTATECGVTRSVPNQYRAPGDDYAICSVGTADLLPGPTTPPTNPTDQSLVLHDRGTGETRVLVSDGGGVTFVGFSPDGEWVIFATRSYPEGIAVAHFGVIRRDGTGRYNFAATDVFPLAGGRLYFAAPAAGGGPGYTLSVLDLATHASHPVVADWPDPAILAASSDGTRLLAIRSASDAPRNGVWRDGELHLFTVATAVAP